MRKGIILMAAVLTVAGVACGSDDDSTATTSTTAASTKAAEPDLSTVEFVDLTASPTAAVQARDNEFVEPYVEVKAGATITFTNKGRNQHNIVPVHEDAFAMVEADAFEPKATTTITFDEPGDYAYYCSLHGTPTKGMIGAVRVLK